jgi:hypothetical protein
MNQMELQEQERAGFPVKWIPFLVPAAAVILNLLIAFIFYEVLQRYS